MISCHTFCPFRAQFHLSPLRPLSASLLAWSPTPQYSLAATAVASPPSVAAVYRRPQALNCQQVTTHPTLCLHPLPCQIRSPVLTSRSAEKTRHRHPIACMRGTTLAGLCHCPTAFPSPHRRTPQHCHPSLTSFAQAA